LLIDTKHSPGIQTRIDAAQIKLLYKCLNVFSISSLLVAIFLALTLFSSVPQSQLLTWLACYLLITSGCIGISYHYRYNSDKYSNQRWASVHLISILALTALWGALIIGIFPMIDYAHQTLVFFLIAGLHMGAANSISFKPAPFVAFTATTSALLLWELATHPEWLSLVGIGLFVIHLPIVIYNAKRIYRTSRQSQQLRLESKEKTELLQRSEQRLRNIVNSAGEIMLIHNIDGEIIGLNDRACELLGYQKDDLLGKKIHEIAGEASEIYHKLLSIMGDDEPMIYEAMYRCEDGSEIPIEASITHYDDPIDGDAVLVLARDLTAKQADQRELLASRQKLDLHIESTPLAVIEWDTHFNIRSWNPAAEQIFGFSADEVIGKNAAGTILPKQFDEQAKVILQQLLNESGGVRSTTENITRDGSSIVCEWYDTPLVDPSGKVLGIASLAMDITQRVRAEQKSADNMRIAERANAAKTDFLARMSHELRTPLNAIIGLSDLLQTDDQIKGERLEHINDIRHAGDHLLSLVSEVLDLSRIERGEVGLQLEDEKLDDIITGAIHFVEPLRANMQVQLNYHNSDTALSICADKLRLTQIITNLLSNAIKYNHRHGKVNLSVEYENGNIKVLVRDNGQGIPKNKQSLIFEPFERAGAEFSDIEGNGIGLMLSRELIHKMGGEIGFDSTVGEGSCFWINLPSRCITQKIIDIAADSTQASPT
jgi:PAS domain S-box-containing protein